MTGYGRTLQSYWVREEVETDQDRMKQVAETGKRAEDQDIQEDETPVPRALVTKAYMEASWQGGPVFTICSSKWFVIVVREGFTSDRQKVGRLENETMTPAVAMST